MSKILIIAVILVVAASAFYSMKGNPQKNIVEIQGMKVEILKQGAGTEAKTGDKITAHYTGWFENGTKFDSSVDRGTPFVFTLGIGQVIRGWDLGIEGMKAGEKRKLTIPDELAYGADGVKDEEGNIIIPGGATLVFEVELLEIK